MCQAVALGWRLVVARGWKEGVGEGQQGPRGKEEAGVRGGRDLCSEAALLPWERPGAFPPPRPTSTQSMVIFSPQPTGSHHGRYQQIPSLFVLQSPGLPLGSDFQLPSPSDCPSACPFHATLLTDASFVSKIHIGSRHSLLQNSRWLPHRP